VGNPIAISVILLESERSRRKEKGKKGNARVLSVVRRLDANLGLEEFSALGDDPVAAPAHPTTSSVPPYLAKQKQKEKEKKRQRTSAPQ
jgi:hypothetical protein